MAAFLKRLRKELQSLERSPDPDIALVPLEDNIRVWNVRVCASIGLGPVLRLLWGTVEFNR